MSRFALAAATAVFGAVIVASGGAAAKDLHADDVGIVESVFITTKDGTNLSTQVFVPLHLEKPERKFPTVLDSSPYGHTGTELIADLYLPFGYATVTQDFRGTGDSDGKFGLWHNSESDAADTIAWIRKQKWSDGRVFTVGASADGIASLLVVLDPTTKLSGQFVIFATASAYSTFFPGGAYRHALIDGWIKDTIPHQATDLIQLVRTKEDPTDAWWDAVSVKDWSVVNAPAVAWAGWYDIFLNGNLYGFDGLQKRTKEGVRGNSFLVVDPLGHCQQAAEYFHGDITLGRVALPILLSYQLYAANDTAVPKPIEGVKAVTFYVMGPNYLVTEKHSGNYWTSLEDWPKSTPTPFYMTANGGLSQTRPVVDQQQQQTDGGALSFLFDPTNPCPTNGGNNLLIDCGPRDQRKLEARDDVLVFTTEVLTEDVAVTGSLNAHLFVSTANANDTDWVVRLTDVYPASHGGRSHLIQDGIVRMRWRHGNTGAGPQPIIPGQVERVSISLWNTSYVFNKGHRIRVSVTSSNHPRFSVNPNLGLPLDVTNETVPPQYIVANNTLQLGVGGNASYVELPIVPLSAMPKVDIKSAVTRKMKEIVGDDDEKVRQLQQAMEAFADRASYNLH